MPTRVYRSRDSPSPRGHPRSLSHSPPPSASSSSLVPSSSTSAAFHCSLSEVDCCFCTFVAMLTMMPPSLTGTSPDAAHSRGASSPPLLFTSSSSSSPPPPCPTCRHLTPPHPRRHCLTRHALLVHPCLPLPPPPPLLAHHCPRRLLSHRRHHPHRRLHHQRQVKLIHPHRCLFFRRRCCPVRLLHCIQGRQSPDSTGAGAPKYCIFTEFGLDAPQTHPPRCYGGTRRHRRAYPLREPEVEGAGGREDPQRWAFWMESTLDLMHRREEDPRPLMAFAAWRSGGKAPRLRRG